MNFHKVCIWISYLSKTRNGNVENPTFLFSSEGIHNLFHFHVRESPSTFWFPPLHPIDVWLQSHQIIQINQDNYSINCRKAKFCILIMRSQRISKSHHPPHPTTTSPPPTHPRPYSIPTQLHASPAWPRLTSPQCIVSHMSAWSNRDPKKSGCGVWGSLPLHF